MMQKEVGERILAQPGTPERGALSVSMQLNYAIRKVCDAPAGAFLPPPKVDSVVLDFLPSVDPPERTIEVVRTGFIQPRKTLANNLLALGLREETEVALDRLHLDRRIRPHQLTNDQWIALSEIV
jgi:16S rRNA (adenine1518-N6/adenine1519-N6)-dimethyltransferase